MALAANLFSVSERPVPTWQICNPALAVVNLRSPAFEKAAEHASQVFASIRGGRDTISRHRSLSLGSDEFDVKCPR
jgi:hypothetical protein